MGYLSCRADSSIATCRSISSAQQPSRRPAEQPPDDDHHHQIQHFTYRELESATRNFSDSALLGRGSHGAVYKAVLPGSNGRPVAVKRPSRRPSLARRDEVENEIDILSRLRSPRLVNLIGSTQYSNTNPNRERLLVVEFMPNGTLYDLLHTKPRPPSWPRRLRLALQTARALLALHSASPPVIHRDVKSANILLDHRLNARLGDFGLALRGDHAAVTGFPSSTPPAGTLGYLDPSYVTPDNLSTKTDVFSFGILLFEIISGRKAIDVAYSPPSVVEWAVPLLKKGKVSVLFDPRITPPRDPAARRQLASLAASCVRSCKERRPTMEEVAEQLKLLCKTVSARTWNGLANPCSVVDTERTLSRLNPNSLNCDPSPSPRCSVVEEEMSASEKEAPTGTLPVLPSSLSLLLPLRNASTRGSRNLKDLMARLDLDTIGVLGVGGSQSSSISRARTLRVNRNYFDRDVMLRLRRNQTIKTGIFDSLPRVNELENWESELHDRGGDGPLTIS